MKNIKTNIIILTFIFAIVLIISLKDDFNEIINQIYNINFWWFILACILMFLYFLLRAFQMHDLIKMNKENYPFIKSLKLVITGQFFANITPSSLGAQPVQVYFLKKDKISISNGTKIILQYNVSYQIALLIISFITIILAYKLNIFKNVDSIFGITELVVMAFCIHFTVLIVLLSLSFSKGSNSFFVKSIIRILSKIKFIKNKEETLLKWDGRLNDFHSNSTNIFNKKLRLIKNIFYNILAILCFYSIPLLLIYAIGDFDSLKLLNANIASSYTNIISSFIPSPGGAGGFEYFFTQFFGVFIKGATLTTLMLLWRAVTYYFVLIIGAIVLLFYKERDLEI